MKMYRTAHYNEPCKIPHWTVIPSEARNPSFFPAQQKLKRDSSLGPE